MSLIDKPLFTDDYEIVNDFVPEKGATYIFGVTSEKRSEVALSIKERSENVKFIEIRETDKFVIETDIENFSRISLRRQFMVENFIRCCGSAPVYIDITGLTHSSWAPLIKVCLNAGLSVRVVYFEPRSYTKASTPRLGELYDLSEQIGGIEPLPLFASLDDPPDDQICFVPLLGFEGTRFAHMLEEVQPSARKTIPVIGVPGFQPDYPFTTFLGNADALERASAQNQIRYAKSNCPFSLYYTLEKLAEKYSGQHFKIGLVGTKPHALGAVLFCLRGGSSTEIVYDHVRRKKNRTSGVDRCLVYNISSFFS